MIAGLFEIARRADRLVLQLTHNYILAISLIAAGGDG